MRQITLRHPLFDGERIMENASVTWENGVITKVSEEQPSNEQPLDEQTLLIPGLIDAHTHMSTAEQVQRMVKCGVVATCDVAAPASLGERVKPFTLVSSAGMTMGTPNGKKYVKKAIADGARYIKVLLFEPNLMPKAVLKSICQEAHEDALKVAVHATSVKAERMAVECGADILLHVPMKEQMPEDWAKELAERQITVAPTLVMMEAFAHSGRNGYLPEHYQNAENAVRILRESGVNLLSATDANPGEFSPAVSYGNSLHREMELLCRAGLTPIETLASATSRVAQVFQMDGLGLVKEGQKACLVLVEGRPDQEITAISKIKQVWIEGEQML